MADNINSEIFEPRNPPLFSVKMTKGRVFLFVVATVVVLLALMVHSFTIGSLSEFLEICRQNPILLVMILMFFLQVILAFSTSRVMPVLARSTLTLDADALTHRCDAPRVLQRVLHLNWRIPLQDIVTVEIVPPPMQAHITSLETALLRIQTRQRLPRMLTPASWYIPGHPDRAVLIPVRTAGHPQTLWTLPENRPILRKALNELPLIKALRARGIAVADNMSATDVISQDMLAHRAVKFALTVGLFLVTTSLFLMMWRANQHLQMSVSIWVYAGLVAAALTVMWLLIRQDIKRPPLAHSIVASCILCVGACMAFQPFILLVNGFLYDSAQTQTFVAQAGVLKPVSPQCGIGEIEPSSLGRAAWLKDGTSLQLTVKRGRLGVWEYEDLPLRAAADAQGIR